MKHILTDKRSPSYIPETWGGIECTINRISDTYCDQLSLSKHYSREGDLDKIAELGIKKLRYPVLWELFQPAADTVIDWTWAEKQLTTLRQKSIDPIVGLTHHGSGPIYTDLLSDDFATGLAEYAHRVAENFPWVNYYTPVNEPLTTARFSGMYGLWYPHHRKDTSFVKMLLNQVKAVVLSMKAIRSINPNAKLIQTEDLGKTYSTPFLQFQANFENERRWLTFDLLCGKVNPEHLMWKYFMRLGIPEKSLHFFLDNPCPPNIIGLNYYITSERFIDEDIKKYPSHTHGGNEIQIYADVEAIRIKHEETYGLKVLLKEAWDRFGIPLAITEVQLNSTREEQLKWLLEVWNSCTELRAEDIRIEAVTAWSLLGAFGWNRLLTSKKMQYEPGVFDIRSGELRPTALATALKTLSSSQTYSHPVIIEKGWWHRESRYLFTNMEETGASPCLLKKGSRPILIIGKTGTLAKAFARVCNERHISCQLSGRENLDITREGDIEKVIREHQPWAIVNAAGFVKIDEAENDPKTCFDTNSKGPELLAIACKKYDLQFMTFSSDMVFDGNKNSPYDENDRINPLNVYGKSKAQAENLVLKAYPGAMVVRTSAFFSPWDKYNFVHDVIETLSNNDVFRAADNIIVSPTYVPDLVHTCLDLLIDKEKGVWHLVSKGQTTWAQFAITIAEKAGLDTGKILSQNYESMNWKAVRPIYSVLKSSKGDLLPTLKNAINRYLNDRQAVSEVSPVHL